MICDVSLSLRLLTCSSSLHFLRRDRKDREKLDHDLHEHLRHFRGQRYLSIDLKTLEKALDAFKQVDNSTLACSGIFRRLYNSSIRGMGFAKRKSENTDTKEGSNSSEYYFRGRECLQSNCQNTLRMKMDS